MRLLKTVMFEFEGSQYEIRIYNQAWDFKVKAYLNDSPANGYSYSANLPTAIDLNLALELDAIQYLVELAKHDIESKLWEKVETHIKNLNKGAAESLGCRKCGSRNIIVHLVDERDMFECQDCTNIWYAKRKTTRPHYCVLDDITEDVATQGSHEVDASVLLNVAFRPEAHKELSFEDQLKNWSIQNKLKYESFSRDGQEFVRFWR